MKQITYYTVIIGKRACIVTYAQSPAYETKLFSGSFDDPGEASQEFKIAIEGEPEYLTPGVFDRKVSNLAYRYQQDCLKLAEWNRSSQPTSGRKSPMVLTNEQYISALSASGLELAEDYLEQDLTTLQENGLPVSDTVAGILMVQSKIGEQDNEIEEEAI